MPPFTVDRLKSVPYHGVSQKHPVFILFIGNAPEIRMRYFAEQIERTSHIHFPAGFHIEKRQVDRASPAVTGLFCNVAFDKKLLLLQVRIKIRFHPDILILDAPENKLFHSPCGAVCVKYLEPVSFDKKLTADLFQGPGRFYGQKRTGFFISADSLTDKIVVGIIADFLDNMRDKVRQHHKTGGIHRNPAHVIHFTAPFCSLTVCFRMSFSLSFPCTPRTS